MIDHPCTDHRQEDLLKNREKKKKIFNEEYQRNKVENAGENDRMNVIDHEMNKKRFFIF